MSVVLQLIIVSLWYHYTDECRPIRCFDEQVVCVCVCMCMCLCVCMCEFVVSLIIRSRGSNHNLMTI